MSYKEVVNIRNKTERLLSNSFIDTSIIDELHTLASNYGTTHNNYQQSSSNFTTRKYWFHTNDSQQFYKQPINISSQFIPRGNIDKSDSIQIITPTILNQRNTSSFYNQTVTATFPANKYYYMSAAVYQNYTDVTKEMSPLLSSSGMNFAITLNRSYYALTDSTLIKQIPITLSQDTSYQLSYSLTFPSGVQTIYEGTIYCNPIIFYSSIKLPPRALPRIYYFGNNVDQPFTPIDCVLQYTPQAEQKYEDVYIKESTT